METLANNPVQWRLSTLLSLETEQVHDLACWAVGTLTSFRLVLGRCLLALHQNKGFKKYGCSTAVHYGSSVLGVNHRLARECKRVATQLQELPCLSLAAERGEISWGKLREIVRVAVPETEEFWIALAQQYDCQAIQILVSKTPYGKVPGEVDLDNTCTTEFRFSTSPQVIEMFKRAQRLFSLEQDQALSGAETLECLLASFLSNRPLDSEVLEEMRSEADKDLQAEQARRIPAVLAARDLAKSMGLLKYTSSTCAASETAPSHHGEREVANDEAGPSHHGEREVANDEAAPSHHGEREVAKGEAPKDEAPQIPFAQHAVENCESHAAQRAVENRAARAAHPARQTTAPTESTATSNPPEMIEESPSLGELLSLAIGTPLGAPIFGHDYGELDDCDDDCCQSKRPRGVVSETEAAVQSSPETLAAWRNTRLRFNPTSRHTTSAQKKEILRRDGWCCMTPGCPNRVWMHLHHVKPYSEGGKTTRANLISCCAGCHRNLHDGHLKITPTAQGKLVFTDAEGRRLDTQADLQIAGWIDFWMGWRGKKNHSHQARVYSGDWTVFGSASRAGLARRRSPRARANPARSGQPLI